MYCYEMCMIPAFMFNSMVYCKLIFVYRNIPPITSATFVKYFSFPTELTWYLG